MSLGVGEPIGGADAAALAGLEIPGVVHRRIDVGEVTLHVALAGEGTGPLVVLLHGFPELWWSWRYQIPALVAAGFRVAAPDLRGYNLSNQPPLVSDYGIAHLVADIDGLIRALGETKAHVVAHDWGAVVAWELTMRRPERVARLSILNVPHPAVMQRALTRSPAQIRRSWYIFLFQVPHLPELIIQRNDFASVRASLSAGRLVRPTPEELEPYIDSAKRSDSLRGGVNYYRAALREAPRRWSERSPRIDHEVLVIWGERDLFLGRELATPPKKLVPNARVEFLPEASHWVQVDAPSRVSSVLVPFLSSS
jgi:pimeloyl-ACP methyl ester carboxylesterase